MAYLLYLRLLDSAGTNILSLFSSEGTVQILLHKFVLVIERGVYGRAEFNTACKVILVKNV